MTLRTTTPERSERVRQIQAWLQKIEQRQANIPANTSANIPASSSTNTLVTSPPNSSTTGLARAAQGEQAGEQAGVQTGGLADRVAAGDGGERTSRLVSLGCAALDRLLPAGGLGPGTLVEWLEADGGGGAGSLALAAARQACLAGGLLVVLDRARRFYPPVLAAWGFSLDRVVVVRPERSEDEIWAADQALRCPAVAAVWGAFEWIGAVDFRRLKLAAEEGGTLGLLRRPARLLGQPTWADAQWWVRPRIPPCRRADSVATGTLSGANASSSTDSLTGTYSLASAGPSTHVSGSSPETIPWTAGRAAAAAERHLQATLVRCRGGVTGRTVALAWNERTGQLRATGEMTPAESKATERVLEMRKPRAANSPRRMRETG